MVFFRTKSGVTLSETYFTSKNEALKAAKRLRLQFGSGSVVIESRLPPPRNGNKYVKRKNPFGAGFVITPRSK